MSMTDNRISQFKHKLKNFIQENGQDINVYEMIRILHDIRNEVEECAMKATTVRSCFNMIDGPARLRKEPEQW
jgi:hypothetical protein